MSASLDQMIRSAITSSGSAPRTSVRRPQVSLLPAEIRGDAHGQRVRTAVVAVVVASAVLVGGGVALSAASADGAESRQSAALADQAAATRQLSKFKDVQDLQQRIALDRAAVRVGSSTALDWQRWSGLILADMPAGFVVTGIQADAATPYLDYPQGSTPLEQPRAASFQVTAQSPSIEGLPIWLRKLKSLPAYADLTPTVNKTDDGYTVIVMVHLTAKAFVKPVKESQ